MYTVYLDKNIYSYLTKDPLDPLYETLGNILLDRQKELLVFYSYAHIEDLKNSMSSPKVEDDLLIIEKIAQKNYCYYDNEHKKFCLNYYSPKEIWDAQEDILPFIDEAMEGDISSLITQDLRDKIENLKRNWSDANPITAIKDEKEIQLLSKFFPTNLDSLTTEEILKECYRRIRSLSKERGIYRELRAHTYNTVNKGKFTVGPMSYKIQDLSDSPLKRHFYDFVLASIVKGDDGFIAKYDFHISAYTSLDLLGYNRDKDVVMDNLMTDALHSYYGGHFDVVVSNDKGFVIKSRALYQYLGLNTIVLFPQEFISEFNSAKFSLNETATQLIMRIKDDWCKLKTEMKPEQDKAYFDNKGENGTFLYASKKRYLDYFDSIGSLILNNTEIIILGKDLNKYLEYRLPTKLIYRLIDKCYEIFGTDSYNEGKIQPESNELKKLDEGEWVGRVWVCDQFKITLSMANRKLLLTVAS